MYNRMKLILLVSLVLLLISAGAALAQSGGTYDAEQYVVADAGEFVDGGAYLVGFTCHFTGDNVPEIYTNDVPGVYGHNVPAIYTHSVPVS